MSGDGSTIEMPSYNNSKSKMYLFNKSADLVALFICLSAPAVCVPIGQRSRLTKIDLAFILGQLYV